MPVLNLKFPKAMLPFVTGIILSNYLISFYHKISHQSKFQHIFDGIL